MTCIESALYYNLSSKYCENETPIANSGSLAINDHKKKTTAKRQGDKMNI